MCFALRLHLWRDADRTAEVTLTRGWGESNLPPFAFVSAGGRLSRWQAKTPVLIRQEVILRADELRSWRPAPPFWLQGTRRIHPEFHSLFPISSLDSPAIKSRSAAYPFGGKVPSRVRMLRTCMPDASVYVEPQHYPIAYIGAQYACFVESNGEVAAILPNGQLIHVPHDAFMVVAFHQSRAAETMGTDYFHALG